MESMFTDWIIPSTRAALKEIGIETIGQIVSGITGFYWERAIDWGEITALLSEASPIYPDARSAAIAVEALVNLQEWKYRSRIIRKRKSN